MSIIGARASDWHSGNPDIHPLRWFGLFVAAIAFYIVVMAAVGSFVNGG